MEKKLSMRSSIAWNSIGSMFYLGCQWLMTVFVVRISGVEDAGLLTLAMSATNIWYCLAVYGMRNFQVSDTHRKYADGTYIFSRILTTGLSFLGCLAYVFLVPYDGYQRLCILSYFLYKATEAFYDVYAGIFQIHWRLDCAGKSMLLRGMLTISFFLLVLHFSENMVLTFLCMAGACGLSVLCYDLRMARKMGDMRLVLDWKKVCGLLAECFPLVVYTILSSAIGSVPRLYMERILGGYELGIYGTVAAPTLIIQMVATYVFNPFVTLFAEKYYAKEGRAFLSILGKCVVAVAGIALAGILGGALLGRWGLNLLYGEEVASYHALLVPIILCTTLTAFAWLLCGVLTAIREFRGLVSGNLAAVLVALLFSGIFEKKYGMQGASLALGVATTVEIAVMAAFLWRNLKRQFAEA